MDWPQHLLAATVEAVGAKGGFVGALRTTEEGARIVELLAAIGLSGLKRYDATLEPCREVLAGRSVTIAKDAQRRFAKHPLIARAKAASYRAQPIRNDKGRVVGLIGVFGRAKAKADPRAAKLLATNAALAGALFREVDALQRYREIVDALPILIEARDQRLHLTVTNSASADAGFAALSPVQAEELEALDEAVLATGEPVPFFELRMVDPDGRESAWWTAKQPLFAHSGEKDGVLTVAVEVTEFHRARREVEETQKLLRTVIDSIPAAISVQDVAGRFVVANAKLETLIDPAPSSAGSRGDASSEGVAELDAALAELDRQVRAKGESTGFVEGRRIDAHGKESFWLVDKIPFLSAEGKVDRILTVAIDVSARRRAEVALRELNRRLEAQRAELEVHARTSALEREKAIAASRAKSEFLANMSHEFRTPLNAIIGYSEIIVERMFGRDSPKYLEYSKDILESARHLLNLINDVLDMSRIEAGQLTLRVAETDLGALIDESLRMMRVKFQEKSIALETDLGPGLGAARIDPRAIKQVMINLLSNAAKFTPEGGKVAVEAGVRADGSLGVRVDDTGIGIKPEDLERLFEVFWQGEAPDVRRHEGSGLGLAISKRLVEMHGGTLTIRSAVGRGTSAEIRLPPFRRAA